MRTIRLALLGFGNAGRAFAKLLAEKADELRRAYGTEVMFSAVTTGSHGALTETVTPSEALRRYEAGAFAGKERAMEIVTGGDYDVLVELTPLNIRTGQPAIDHIRGAFSRGKDVITANKGPIAWAYDELRDMAQKNGCRFYFETTVMDGTPVFNLVEHTLKLAKVTEVSGILNTTTNYILEELAAGKAYDAILAEGRRLGFIEADAAMDIEGYDAAAKITALLNVLMQAHITPDQVERTGIERITLADIRAAAERDCVIKLLCRGWREGARVRASVRPVEVKRGELLSGIDSTSSVVSITTDLMGKLSIVEHAPLIEQTAYGVFGDLLRILSEP